MSELDRKAIAILRGALDTDPVAVDAYISRQCETDPELANRVRALLSKVRDDTALDFSEPVPGSRVGAIVADRYRLLDRLGVGGMGEVYRAERIDGDFRQEVALKLVHGGFAALIDRFRRERQILARLTHPNIAHMIDGGVDNDGTPWLAMEFVDGERITTWCDARNLDLPARVDLMRRICDAVQFAHRNLIVHRDIKPANVLVADDGTPKLLDFGIAKLLDGSDIEATQTLAMTPAYAAPEQRRGEPVSTATDVYQLGLVLFDLLSGTSLHEARRLERGAGDTTGTPSMARAYAAITTREPDAAETMARQRKVSSDRLRTVLKGDLGRIVTKALADAPTERYGSARELADDLERWRDDRPIVARRESLLYRSRKFIRRHRIAVTFAGLSVASLAAAVVGMAWKTAEATRETQRATAVQAFLVGLFETNAPTSTRNELPTTAELLDAGVARVRSDFNNQPETRADLLAAIGRIYLQQSQYDKAAPLVSEALALREQLHGPADPLVLESLVDSIKLAITTDRIDAAREYLDRARALAIGADDSSRIELSLASCIVLFYESRYDESAAECLQTVAMIESAEQPPVALVAPAYAQLSSALQRVGRNDESIDRTLEGLERIRALHGKPHYDEMMVYSSLILALKAANRYEEAAQIGRDAVALSEDIFDGAHPEFADNLFALGTVLAIRGDPGEAERYLRRSIAMYEDVFGPSLTLSTADLMYARLHLATLLTRMGRPGESETLLRGTLAELEAHPQLREYLSTHAEVWIFLAQSLIQQDRLVESRGLLERALSVLDTPDNADRYPSLIGQAHTGLAMIAMAEQRSDDAIRETRLALDRLDAVPELTRPAAAARLQLGRALLDTGDVAGASTELAAALAVYASVSGDASPETIVARIELAGALTMAGNAADAAIQLAAARAGAASLPATHPLRARLAALPD